MKFRRFTFNPFHKSRIKSKKKQNNEEDLSSQNTCRNKPNVTKDETQQEYCAIAGDTENLIEYKAQEVNIDIDIKSQYRLGQFDAPFILERSQKREECAQYIEDRLEGSYGVSVMDRGADYDADGNSNTLKKCRTRIKTNPWLPSPRLSPASFKSSDNCEAENTSDSDFCDRYSESSKVCAAITRHFSFENNDTSSFVTKNNGDGQSVKNTMQQGQQGCHTNSSQYLKPLDENDNYRWSIISEGDVSVDLSVLSMDELRDKFSNLEHKVDFDYENNLDEVLENDPNGNNRLSIIDLLDDNATCDSASSLESSISSSEDMTSSAEFARSRESSIMTDSDISESNQFFFPQTPDSIEEEDSFSLTTTFQKRVHNMDDSIDAGYSSLSRDGKMSASEYSDSDGMYLERPKFRNETDEEDAERTSFYTTSNQMQASNDSEFNYGNFEEDLFLEFLRQPTGRTFSEVEMSLEDKVHQLRFEKLVVEQKIREAREAEDQIGAQNMDLRRQKSELLFDQLSGLKSLLKEQNDRLQKNYYKILSLQRRHRRTRQPFVFMSGPELNGR